MLWVCGIAVASVVVAGLVVAIILIAFSARIDVGDEGGF